MLDDSEGSLALGASEISIYRRLDRNGEGEYRLAGARCRLVDVVELLSDTGLGKEMHSVISQGRVESIVTSKPRERRLLIEEAAGLGKHRKRRRRAQLKLARTQDNLDRALDVEREARSRLRPLKRQAEAAELHARLERQALEIRWELARDGLRTQRRGLAEAETGAAEVRARRSGVEQELKLVAGRREAAEEALAARSAQREELSRRAYVARAAAERVGYRAEATRSATATVEGRLARSMELLESLRAAAAQDAPDPEAQSRIAALEEELAGLDRDREVELSRQLEVLDRAAEEAAGVHAAQSEAVEHARLERERGEARAEEARAAVREAERAVEAARREAARVGADLAAVNQFLRHQVGAPGGARALADELDADPGYELALAAALDGRLRAAIVADLKDGGDLLDRAGADGGRTLVLGSPVDPSGENAGSRRGGAPGRPPARRWSGARAGPAAAALDLGRGGSGRASPGLRGRGRHPIGSRLVGPDPRAAPDPGRRRGARPGRAQPALGADAGQRRRRAERARRPRAPGRGHGGGHGRRRRVARAHGRPPHSGAES